MRKLDKDDFIKYLNETFMEDFISKNRDIEETLMPFIENDTVESFDYTFEDDSTINFAVEFSDMTEIEFSVKENKITLD